MKRLLVVFLSLCLVCCSNLSISVLAKDNAAKSENVSELEGLLVDNYEDEGFKIMLSNQRIDGMGYFNYRIRYSVKSNSFTVRDDTITMEVCGYVLDPYGNDVTSEYPGKEYEIRLYKDNFWNTLVGSYVFEADGEINEFTISELSTDASYYIKITCDTLPTDMTISGGGRIWGVASVETDEE